MEGILSRILTSRIETAVLKHIIFTRQWGGSSHTRHQLEWLGMKMDYHNIIMAMITEEKECNKCLICDFKLLPHTFAAPEEKSGCQNINSAAVVCACVWNQWPHIILDISWDKKSLSRSPPCLAHYHLMFLPPEPVFLILQLRPQVLHSLGYLRGPEGFISPNSSHLKFGCLDETRFSNSLQGNGRFQRMMIHLIWRQIPSSNL